VTVASRTDQVLRLFGRAPSYTELLRLLRASGANLERATGLLLRVLEGWPDDDGERHDLVTLEHEGDRITHDIIQRLNSTFVTPIDREDILELTSDMDDIIDLIDEVADYLGLYKIEAPMEQSQRMAHILLQATRQIAEAMPRLRTFQDLSHFTVEVNRLENDGDRTSRHAIASLFDNGIDPMVVIRWKDIFERLEEAIDACEHVANTLEGIVIKNS
jgi:predicted phosphate transport protein (TIGR00153 family)